MRSKPSAEGVLAIACLAAFTVWISWRAKVLESKLQGSDQAAGLVHKPAPDFSLVSLDGSTISLADFRGKKKIVLTYWASWCGPCRLEMPTLRAFYQRVHKPDSRFEILAISIDDDSGAAQRFATEVKLPFPVLLDTSEKAAAAYGVSVIPATFVVDENGTVVYGHTGLVPGVDLVLARELGIDNYSPVLGGPSGKPSH